VKTVKRSKRHNGAARGVLALHILMIVLVIVPQQALAVTITVDGQTGDAPGTCDLVEAIENAETDSAVNVDCAAGSGDDEVVLTVDVTLTEPVSGQNGLPAVSGANGATTIEGGNHSITRDPGSDPFRFFAVDVSGDLTLNEVTLSGGLVAMETDASTGGAIENLGTLAITNSTISGNTASGGGVFPRAYGGGLYNLGSATISSSTFDNNTAEAVDGASPFTLVGGAAISNGTLYAGAVSPTLSLTASTISNNYAAAVADGASLIYGGGIYAALGTTTITNSTLSGNSAYSSSLDSGAYGGAVELTDSDVTLRSTTVSGNSVDAQKEGAAGIHFDAFGGGSLDMYDSIVGNHSPLDNCFGVKAPQNGGDNLSDDTSCGTIPDTLTLLDAVLMDNGGPTSTHAIMAGSTAIDLATTCGLAVDQRGVARPVDECDSGSYEFAPCQAADGDTFAIPDLTIISTEETFETCVSITLADVDVVGPSGHLILRTAGRVEIGDGFEVEVDGRLTVEIDSGIVMPASS